MSQIEIRQATPADTTAVAALFDAYRQFYQQPADHDGAANFIGARLTNEESVIFVASANGTDVGFTLLYPSFSSVSMAPIWILNDLYVSGDHRGLGAGTALLRAAETFAAERGAKRLCLATAQDNTTAQRLYESLQWKRDSFLHYDREL